MGYDTRNKCLRWRWFLFKPWYRRWAKPEINFASIDNSRCWSDGIILYHSTLLCKNSWKQVLQWYALWIRRTKCNVLLRIFDEKVYWHESFLHQHEYSCDKWTNFDPFPLLRAPHLCCSIFNGRNAGWMDQYLIADNRAKSTTNKCGICDYDMHDYCGRLRISSPYHIISRVSNADRD